MGTSMSGQSPPEDDTRTVITPWSWCRARMDGPRRGGVSEDALAQPLALFSFIHFPNFSRHAKRIDNSDYMRRAEQWVCSTIEARFSEANAIVQIFRQEWSGGEARYV